jgi:hypothetical protein
VSIVNELIEELVVEDLAPSLVTSLEQSCLVPMLEVYLRNDSITDMVLIFIINSIYTCEININGAWVMLV